MRRILLIVLQLFLLEATAQCQLQSEVLPNGTLIKKTKRELLYYTKAYSLYGRVSYDGKNYFMELVIKPENRKELKKETMKIRLANGKRCELPFYDVYQHKADTSLNVLFEIKREYVDLLANNDIKEISFPIEEGVKSYNLVRHRDLTRRQLACLMAEQEKK